MATAAEGLPEAGAQPAKQDPAVETAEEAKEPAEADINELCKDMFNKMATYLTGELTATSEDYKLLENMNKLTSLKYLEMKDIAINISRNLKDLNQKYAALQPYLEQINLIEEQVAALEQAAYKLDAYSKKLGNYLQKTGETMKLQQSLSWSSTMSQTDFCLSCTTAILYVDKDLVTANIKTGLQEGHEGAMCQQRKLPEDKVVKAK
ncbi:biogenesis of lysosome-related organelles complex 1 subunit 2 isoform X1 [Harpia harpyja]|uniref:biogenesis of lysosome-related organelles complex 1 subunit 2 isoform X1 n=1 Tax=Harpia harpyja TaxID=202280 RepID=UPI0022B186F4|nr:biogenesis of lysosome-related organelles complex 1 subunit 2 isoform X1 [Harpia harpyja]